MYFTTIISLVTATIGAMAAPVARDDTSILGQATKVLDQLNDVLQDITLGINSATGGLLHPFDYNIPYNVHNAFTKAIEGVAGLPELPEDENKPEYVVYHFRSLPATVADATFGYIKALAAASRVYANDEQYSAFEGSLDECPHQFAGLHRFVLGLNAKFSGFSCDLAKRVGINTIPGQALAQVSEHTFEIAFDAINPGNCS